MHEKETLEGVLVSTKPYKYGIPVVFMTPQQDYLFSVENMIPYRYLINKNTKIRVEGNIHFSTHYLPMLEVIKVEVVEKE